MNYKIIKDFNGNYAVFSKATGFYQQISKWYFYKQCSYNKLYKLRYK